MRPRVVIPEPWAALWAGGGASRPPRAFVVLLGTGGGRLAPLGTVVAPTALAALHVARCRWPGGRRHLAVRAAAATRAAELLIALALDAAL